MFNDKSTRPYIRLVRILAALLGLLQLAYFLLAWCFPDASQLGPVSVSFYPRGMEPGAVAGLTQGMRWSGLLLALPALLLLGYALLRLDRMLRACTEGRMFALATVAHMKAFIGCVLASLALGVIEPVLRTLVWRHGFGSTARGSFSLGVSSEELTLLLICALFFVVASLMHEARRIAEENEGFV